MLGGQICLIWGSDFEFASYFFAYAKFEKGCVIELAILLPFSKTRELWSSKANWHLRFSLPSIILVDLSGNRTLLQRVQRSWFVICDCWISIRFVCFCVSRFVACDRNYDRRQRKTQLWRRLLSFRVRVFVKSAVTKWTRQPWQPRLRLTFVILTSALLSVIIPSLLISRVWIKVAVVLALFLSSERWWENLRSS